LTTNSKNTDATICPSDSVDINNMTEEQKNEELAVPAFICLKDGVTLEDMSEEERVEFNEGIQDMLKKAQQLFDDESNWKPKTSKS